MVQPAELLMLQLCRELRAYACAVKFGQGAPAAVFSVTEKFALCHSCVRGAAAANNCSHASQNFGGSSINSSDHWTREARSAVHGHIHGFLFGQPDVLTSITLNKSEKPEYMKSA